jgi:protocatechuate 3,4-dioxygenase beta subunit
MTKSINRRKFLLGLPPVLGAGALAWVNRNELVRWAVTHSVSDEVRIAENQGLNSPSCRLTPEQTEGPFYVRSPFRSDIREDRDGLAFELNLQLLSDTDCHPISDATVEIWHCDAAGRYSGYPEDLARHPWETLKLVGISNPNGVHVEPFNSKTFLRGAQTSNAGGWVKFTTIFPGWYDPRVPHIHIVVTVNGIRRFTSQAYFPMDFANRIYASHPSYVTHDLCPYDFRTDPVLAEFPKAEGLLVKPQEQADRLKADMILALIDLPKLPLPAK